MFKFIFYRLLQIIPVLLVIITLTFVLVRSVPGGPFSAERKVSAHVEQKLKEHYGMDKPLYVQYFTYLWNVTPKKLNPAALIKFDLKEGLGIDLVLSLWLNLFPVSGWNAPGGFSWTDNLPYRVLPVLTLGFYYAAGLARLTRGGMLDVLNQDYIRTARAKGLSAWKVTVKHALRAGLIPVVSYLGPVTAGLLSGSFIIEMIFQIPGLGRHFINAAVNRDYTLVMGTVLFYSTLIILMNLLVDVIMVLLNPKLKFD